MKDDRRADGLRVRRRRLSLIERERLLEEFRESRISQRGFSASKRISVARQSALRKAGSHGRRRRA